VFAIVLALLASVSWGFSDFWGGLVTRRVAVFAVIFISQAVGFVAVAVMLGLSGDAFPGLDDLWPVALSAPLGVLGLAALYRGMAIGTMSIVAPISATGVAVPVIVGLATGDRLQAFQLVGIVAAAVGAILAATEVHEDAEQSRDARRGVVLAVTAALCFGVNYVGLDASADASTWWALMGGRVTELLVVMILVIATGTSLRLSRPDLGVVAGIGAFDAAGLACFALATTSGLLSVASVLSALFPIVIVILARVLLGERVRPIQAIGISLAMTGVALIAAG